MIKKGVASGLLRKLHLIFLADQVRYHLLRIKNYSKNRRFLRENPDVKLPPDDLMYESFQIDYHKYYTESRRTADWLVRLLERHTLLNEKHILDWGCGPGRIIRHLPEIIGNGCTMYGTDYNARSIAWCTSNLPGINFNHNKVDASLPYGEGAMDVIYGISILTHLSGQKHFEWVTELLRVLKPGGILLLTTQGDNFKVKLTPSELRDYEQGKLVVRGKVKEGHRTYSAFHPAEFMQLLYKGTHILEHITEQPQQGRWLPQDVWIVRKI